MDQDTPTEKQTTFAEAVYDSARRAASEEAGNVELQGHSREHFLGAIKAITDALQAQPKNISLHVVLFAVTYVRNALLSVMQANQSDLMRRTGGTG
jgi:hypothetical protein